MNRFGWMVLLVVMISLGISGCYTTLRLPHQAAEGEQEEAGWHSEPLNASVPGAHAGDTDWLFYYQLPWWHDESELVYDRPAGQPFVPDEFRQRYPEASGYSGSYSGSPSPSVTSSLSKQPADSSQKPAENGSQDNRRDFGQGATPAPSAGSSAPQPERRDSGSSSGASSDRPQPKRR